MNSIIAQHQLKIRQICHRYGVERLELFGSAATEHFDPGSSDFDFIVRFQDPKQNGISLRYFGFAEEMEKILKHPIDLLTEKPFTNPYFAQAVAQTREVIYDQRSEEAAV